MDILDMLMDDHRKVDRLFAEGKTLEAVDNLKIHDVIEMEVLYTEARAAGLAGPVDHAEEEHEFIRRLMLKISEGDMSVVEELKTNVAEHVAEEEGEFFPMVRSRISSDDLREMYSRALQYR